MADNPRDNNPNPADKRDQSNIHDPNRERDNDGKRPQQEARDQGRQQQGRPDDKRDERKPQQR